MSESEDDEPPLLVELDAQNDEDHGANNDAPLPVQQPDIPDLTELPPCPVTILSGFLGSGKTTLIQYILKSPDHKYRIAVIENEFGAGLDVESIIAKDGVDNSSLADFIELPNGCVCCTVKDNLVVTLETLIQKRRDLDYILIEASGMANPGPIASVFWLDDELESRIRLDGVVTIVDAYHIKKQLGETQEASQQIAYADRILLNKTDLVPSTEDIRRTLRAMNPAAEIRSTTFAKIPDLEWILDAKCYQDNQGAAKIGQTVEEVAAELDHEHDHEHDESCVQCHQQKFLPPDHSHTGAVSTFAFVERGTMDFEKLNGFLASTLWPNQDEKDEVLRSRLEQQLAMEESNGKQLAMDEEKASSSTEQQIFRIKGVVSARRNQERTDSQEWAFCNPQTGIDGRLYIVQAVYDLWEIHPSSETFDAAVGECKLVVIGRHLKEGELRRGLQACLI